MVLFLEVSKMKAIRITAKVAGFRRCGLAHSNTPTDHPDGTFSAEQLEILKNDPMLKVEEVEVDDSPAETFEAQEGNFEGEIKRLEEKLATVTRVNETLLHDLNAVRETCGELLQKIDAMKERESALEQEIQEYLASIDRQEKQIATLENERDAALQELPAAREQIATLEKALAEKPAGGSKKK